MSIIATMLAALGGSSAAAGATGAAASTAGTAATAGAGSSFLGGLMDKGAAAISSMGEAVGMTGGGAPGANSIEQLNSQLEMLKTEAEAIKSGTTYASEEDRQTDLAMNAKNTQDVVSQIEAINKSSGESGLEGTLKNKGSSGAKDVSGKIATGSVQSGQVDQNALMGAAMSGLSGTLGGAPKTTQQQLIMAQNNAFGGFKV